MCNNSFSLFVSHVRSVADETTKKVRFTLTQGIDKISPLYQSEKYEMSSEIQRKVGRLTDASTFLA